MLSPKISIVTAVFNNIETVASSINSTLDQTYKNIELVVIDGGSTDGTLDLLKSYGNKIHVLISEKDKGIYDALNKGIKNATGDVIGFMHSDDLFDNDHVLKSVANTFQINDVDSVYGDLVYVSKDNTDKVVRYWNSGDYSKKKLTLGWMPPHPTFYMKRSCYQEFGLFNLDYKISADYDSMLRYLWKHDISTQYIPEVLIRMRVGGVSNRSLSNIICKTQEDYQIIRANKIGGKRTLFMKNAIKIPQFLIKKSSYKY